MNVTGFFQIKRSNCAQEYCHYYTICLTVFIVEIEFIYTTGYDRYTNCLPNPVRLISVTRMAFGYFGGNSSASILYCLELLVGRRSSVKKVRSSGPSATIKFARKQTPGLNTVIVVRSGG